jgi:Ca2+-transporting ATPase
LALAVDPFEPDLMRRQPRNPRTGIFTRPVITLMVIGGLWSTLVTISVFRGALASDRGTAEAMTMTFVTLVLIEFFKAFNFRSDRHSVLRNTFANKWLNLSIVWELALILVVVYTPFLQKPLGTFALTGRDWVICALAAATVTPILEMAKFCLRRGWFGKVEA